VNKALSEEPSTHKSGWWADHVRDNVAGTFHPVGICRMGRVDDPQAVVDVAGRVRGVGGLRVVDASIMPTLPRGNTNIPTMMMAEKISASILARRRLSWFQHSA
jgi:5-(hydroxymethyl)furfural/furfural oxidase